MSIETIIKAFESAKAHGYDTGFTVTGFLLHPDEIQAITDGVRGALCLHESPSICSSVLGIKLLPNSFIRAVVFAEDYYALLRPDSYEWNPAAIFPGPGIAVTAHREDMLQGIMKEWVSVNRKAIHEQ